MPGHMPADAPQRESCDTKVRGTKREKEVKQRAHAVLRTGIPSHYGCTVVVRWWWCPAAAGKAEIGSTRCPRKRSHERNGWKSALVVVVLLCSRWCSAGADDNSIGTPCCALPKTATMGASLRWRSWC